MDVKKSFKADLGNKRSLFLQIGLVVALALVAATFSFAPEEYRITAATRTDALVPMDLIAVTTQEPKKKEPVKIEVKALTQIIKVIDNNQKIDTRLTFDDIDPDAGVELIPAVKPDVIEEDPVFLIAETMPKFRGGDLDEFRGWVMKNVRFPQVAIDNGVYGRVVLSFVVDKDGRLTNIEVLQSPDRSLAEEAIRVLNTSPKWSPGKQRNQPVRVKYTLPVDFRLN